MAGGGHVRVRSVPDVRIQGAAVHEGAEPRLDGVPVRAPGREGAATRSAAVPLLGDGVPGLPEGELPAGRCVRVRARGVRVLAAPGAVPDAAVQGRAELPAAGVLLRAHAGAAAAAAECCERGDDGSAERRVVRRVAPGIGRGELRRGVRVRGAGGVRRVDAGARGVAAEPLLGVLELGALGAGVRAVAEFVAPVDAGWARALSAADFPPTVSVGVASAVAVVAGRVDECGAVREPVDVGDERRGPIGDVAAGDAAAAGGAVAQRARADVAGAGAQAAFGPAELDADAVDSERGRSPEHAQRRGRALGDAPGVGAVVAVGGAAEVDDGADRDAAAAGGARVAAGVGGAVAAAAVHDGAVAAAAVLAERAGDADEGVDAVGAEGAVGGGRERRGRADGAAGGVGA